jgi:hypothetical protein
MNGSRKIFFVLVLAIGFLPVAAQDAAKVKAVLTKLSQNYDTSTNLGFTIKMSNIVEPEGKKVTTEVSNGYYLLKGKRAVYKIDAVEAMQNDSFFVSVDDKRKYVMVSRPKENGSTQFFPFRQTMDSLLKLSAERYTIKQTIDKAKKIGSIEFNAKDSAEMMKQFVLEYDTDMGVILTLKYFYYEYKRLPEDYKEQNPTPVLHKKTMLIEFSKYSHATIDEALLKETRYVFFEKGACKLAEKYKGYKLYYSQDPLLKARYTK